MQRTKYTTLCVVLDRAHTATIMSKTTKDEILAKKIFALRRGSECYDRKRLGFQLLMDVPPVDALEKMSVLNEKISMIKQQHEQEQEQKQEHEHESDFEALFDERTLYSVCKHPYALEKQMKDAEIVNNINAMNLLHAQGKMQTPEWEKTVFALHLTKEDPPLHVVYKMAIIDKWLQEPYIQERLEKERLEQIDQEWECYEQKRIEKERIEQEQEQEQERERERLKQNPEHMKQMKKKHEDEQEKLLQKQLQEKALVEKIHASVLFMMQQVSVLYMKKKHEDEQEKLLQKQLQEKTLVEKIHASVLFMMQQVSVLSMMQQKHEDEQDKLLQKKALVEKLQASVLSMMQQKHDKDMRDLKWKQSNE